MEFVKGTSLLGRKNPELYINKIAVSQNRYLIVKKVVGEENGKYQLAPF